MVEFVREKASHNLGVAKNAEIIEKLINGNSPRKRYITSDYARQRSCGLKMVISDGRQQQTTTTGTHS